MESLSVGLYRIFKYHDRGNIFMKRPLRSFAAAFVMTSVGCASFAQTSQCGPQPATVSIGQARARAVQIVSQMTEDEKLTLVHGVVALAFKPTDKIPEGAVPGAGYVAGVPRLGVPALEETDGSLGVAYVQGIRKDGATALPSGVAIASTWNPELVEKSGAVVGAEARAKGFNVVLAGAANLMRDPRNGRTFEYLGEDPLLTGVLVGSLTKGIQSNHVISTIKHYAFNGQETGRDIVDTAIGESAARESDLLAFQIGIERGYPGSVMCAYGLVNGAHSCDSDWLLNEVLKRDWHYQGFVMSDWGATPSLDAALHGIDQESGAQADPMVFFDAPLRDAVKREPKYAARLDDMVTRVLTAIYANGLDGCDVGPTHGIDFRAHAAIAEEVAKQGIVLLKNADGVLPLSRTVHNIAVIGGYAQKGVLSGAGSSQVAGEGGPAVVVPLGGVGPGANLIEQYYLSSAPVSAIRALVPEANVAFRDGRYITDAVETARKADVAIVFATQWMTETMDVPDLSLPSGQDALIAAVAEANPRTIVVLETGGPVLMPWLDKVAGVIEAWYPGARGGESIASVLFGDTNPSGRLPVTFFAGLSQLPRPILDGSDSIAPYYTGVWPSRDQRLSVNYNIEGADLGYRWNARKGQKALFPFGYGLSYASFDSSGLRVDGLRATVNVTNTGKRAGDDVAQLYLTDRLSKRMVRLVGFRRVRLEPGETKPVTVEIDPRLIADWRDGAWHIDAGDYSFGIGASAEDVGRGVTVHFGANRWKDGIPG
jgi:beta-glucosidase